MHADLTPLTITDQLKQSYLIEDGDIPCTPEIEPTYDYVWNFCADVTNASYPSFCKGKTGAAVQYVDRTDDGYEECEVIGHYDPDRDDTYYTLYDESDPSLGISMTYLYGDKCPSGTLRSATVDIMCANVLTEVVEAQEPSECAYHVVMKSYHGCPTECPITKKGLCNSHGHCAYDKSRKEPYCYCNTGYSGASCNVKGDATSSSSSSSSNSGQPDYSTEIYLMIFLLLVALVLVAFVGYLAYRVGEFRKEQAYASLPMSAAETEMTSQNFS